MSLHSASKQQSLLDLNPYPFDHVAAFVNSSPKHIEATQTSEWGSWVLLTQLKYLVFKNMLITRSFSYIVLTT